MRWPLLFSHLLVSLLLPCLVNAHGSSKRRRLPPPPPSHEHDDDHGPSLVGSNEECHLGRDPDHVENLRVGAFAFVAINASCWLRKLYYSPGLLMFTVSTTDAMVASPAEEPHKHKHAGRTACDGDAFCYRYFYLADEQDGFYVESNQVGRTVFSAELSLWNASDREELLQNASYGSIDHVFVDSVTVKVVTLRRSNLFHRVFHWSVVALLCVIAFTLGGRTTTSGVRECVQQPAQLMIAAVCQHVIMPMVTFGLIHAIPLTADHKAGLFILSTMSGGGVAHLSVQMLKGNRELSTSIALLNVVLNLAFSTGWLFLFNFYFHLRIRVLFLALWLLPGLSFHMAGLLLRRFCPEMTKAILNWVTQPFLLLFAILFITLGVYLNDYAFHVVREMMVLSVLCLLFAGVFIGGAAGMALRQPHDVYRTIALQSADFNGFLVIVALKSALPQPDADLAASVALWGSVLTPVPAVTYVILHKAKKWTLGFIERRKKKQVREYYSIISNMDKLTQAAANAASEASTANNDTVTTLSAGVTRLSLGCGGGAGEEEEEEEKAEGRTGKEVLATIETITTV